MENSGGRGKLQEKEHKLRRKNINPGVQANPPKSDQTQYRSGYLRIGDMS
jgi:hypothetical protein